MASGGEAWGWRKQWREKRERWLGRGESKCKDQSEEERKTHEKNASILSSGLALQAEWKLESFKPSAFLYVWPPFGQQSVYTREWCCKIQEKRGQGQFVPSSLLGGSGGVCHRHSASCMLLVSYSSHLLTYPGWRKLVLRMHENKDVESWNNASLWNPEDTRLKPTCASRSPLFHWVAQLTVANERAFGVFTLPKHADVGIQVTLIHI